MHRDRRKGRACYEGWRVMGRRTVRWRAMSMHGRAFAATTATAIVLAVAVAVAVAAFCVTVTLSGQAAAVGSQVGAAGSPKPYAFAEDAIPVEGTADTTNSVRLDPGKAYKSSIQRDGKLYYRLQLDATSNAYVSATAIPRAGETVTYADAVKVSVQDGNSRNCSFSETAHFGATQSSRPIAAWASRETDGDRYACQTAGTYYVVVERSGTAGSSSGDWDLELGFVSEPSLKKAGSTTAPETWNSASPSALAGEPQPRPGGAGFTEATALKQGVWQDTISPGQTLFYKVPVDWGQQLYTTAELGSSNSSGNGYVGTALVMSLYNPVRGFVDDVGSGYDGSQRSSEMDPLPPVAYDNRYALNDRVTAMRFPGSYYLVVHLASQVADKFGDGPFGLTLRVRVDGTAQTGPAYAGQAQPRDAFDVPSGDIDDAVGGVGGPGGGSAGDGDSGTMKLIAAGGIGAGSVLVLTLGMWTVVARRRAGTGAGAPAVVEEADTVPAPSASASRKHGAPRYP
ncbi:hypothetical protein OHT59_23330 [Streptomyces sp. NBC_00243]|uniref:hypothetical protein n=1 Tax=Streptomyces sp. NBC_00243 TaxID=2975688 RepID=UPI002DD83CE0|nr:hypothetical protein [Streptomyces sp. NBC_00243]WRZ21227.1 hypothetical protein OHT59_23330 [Streptomyces sp. NBC_00243]